MPKRSNDFQRLIRHILEQLATTSTRVVESAMLDERGSGTPREVDILIEEVVADIHLRVAVECRDHTRRADVKWIDEIIGKYRDLPIDRVVAVSRNGFTRAAAKKASLHRIDTRTLRAALETDWPAEMDEIVMALLSIAVKYKLIWAIEPSDEILDAATVAMGERMLTRADFEAELGAALRAAINRHVLRVVRTEYGDFDAIERVIEHGFRFALPQSAAAITPSGKRLKIEKVRAETVITVSRTAVPTRREMFSNIGVITGIYPSGPDHGPVEVSMLQHPEKDIKYQDAFSLDADADTTQNSLAGGTDRRPIVRRGVKRKGSQ